MSKPVSRVYFFSSSPRPTWMPRRKRSEVSTTRRHVMVEGSMSSRANARFSSAVSSSGTVFLMPSFSRRRSWMGEKAFLSPLTETRRLKRFSSDCCPSCRMRVSSCAASRLFAAVMAWMSPVRCRLNSSMGMHCAYPPPAAPPLMPKTGASEGCRMHVITCFFRCAPSACERPISVVDLPSPSGVGVMPVTTM